MAAQLSERRRLQWSAGLALALHLLLATWLVVDAIREPELQELPLFEPFPLEIALQPERDTAEQPLPEDWLQTEALDLPPSKLEMKWELGSLPVELDPAREPRPVPKPITLSYSTRLGEALRSGRPIRLPKTTSTPAAVYEIELAVLPTPQAEALIEAPDLAESEAAETTQAAYADNTPETQIAVTESTVEQAEQAPAASPPDSKVADAQPEAEPPPQTTPPQDQQLIPLPEPEQQVGNAEPEAPPQEIAQGDPQAQPEVLAEPEPVAEQEPAPAEETVQDDPGQPPPEAEVPVEIAIQEPPPEAPDESAPDRGPGQWTMNSNEFFTKLTAHLYEVNQAVLKVEKPSATRLSVDVRFVMDRDGRVLEAGVLRSTGQPELDEAARAVLIAASPLPQMSDDMPMERLELIAPIEVYR